AWVALVIGAVRASDKLQLVVVAAETRPRLDTRGVSKCNASWHSVLWRVYSKVDYRAHRTRVWRDVMGNTDIRSLCANLPVIDLNAFQKAGDTRIRSLDVLLDLRTEPGPGSLLPDVASFGTWYLRSWDTQEHATDTPG